MEWMCFILGQIWRFLGISDDCLDGRDDKLSSLEQFLYLFGLLQRLQRLKKYIFILIHRTSKFFSTQKIFIRRNCIKSGKNRTESFDKNCLQLLPVSTPQFLYCKFQIQKAHRWSPFAEKFPVTLNTSPQQGDYFLLLTETLVFRRKTVYTAHYTILSLIKHFFISRHASTYN